MIRVDHLCVSYGKQRVLDDVTLQVKDGEFVLVTGPSGCGKSTLARCLNGHIPHSTACTFSGRVEVDGQVTADCTVAEMATRAGLVFQIPSTQLFNLNVDDEVAFGPRNLGLSEDEVERRVAWALAATGIPHLRGCNIQELSGGEQQRLAIASVLAMGPRLLVLDEPTSSLDMQGTRDVLATLARLNSDSGITIVLIEHRLAEVAGLAQRTIIMDMGKIVADGPTAAVFSQRDMLRRLGLRRPVEQVYDDWTTMLEPAATPTSRVIVDVRDVDAGYGSRLVLHGLSMKLYEGEFAALVGNNGAGKSTLARILAGLVKPKRGQVSVGNGHRLAPGRDVGLLFQNPLHQLFCDTVGEEVVFGPQNMDCLVAGNVEAALVATDMTGLRSRSIYALSCGQQQRTALAAILAVKPQLIILDEPTIGQDWRHLSMFMDFLRTLNQAGTTILLITHDYKLVYHYARRIMVLEGGRIAIEGAPHHVHPVQEDGLHAVENA
jgi:energy-coupling factor transport system ATP-binding protein